MRILKAHFVWAFLLLNLQYAGLAGAASLFEDVGILEVTLSGPLGSLIKQTEQREEQSFVLHADGVDHDIKVRIRGNSRVRVCDFPPLRLNFSTADTAGTVFADQDKLKLVTHCRNYDRAEMDSIEEFMAYRILNIIQDASYRVRLLRFHYDDTDRELDAKAAERFGFLIESEDQLAARIGADRAQLQAVPKRMLDPVQAAKVFVFQYLIANTDWGLVKADYAEVCCHNIDLFEKDGRLILVPYDFDLAGVVNAQYAFPDSSLRIKRVTQRLYRGLCVDREALRTALQAVKSRREDILAVLAQIPGLSADDVQARSRYLGKFFAAANDEEKLLRNFERRCK